MEVLHLDRWISEKIGGGVCAGPLARGRLEAFQLVRLRDTLALVKERSPFYRLQLRDFDINSIVSLKDIELLPFTTQEDLRQEGGRMVCVPQTEIHRIVTLSTSGTTGMPKRIYFTKEDQELTIDFFNHGMRNLVAPGDRVLVLLPCQRPGSVGTLLAEGLERLGVRALSFGLPEAPIVAWTEETPLAPPLRQTSSIVTETTAAAAPTADTTAPAPTAEAAAEALVKEGATALVGGPAETLAVALAWERLPGVRSSIHSVLLSTDYIPEECCRELERIWGCRVFEHYGMTEMGLGGAVACGEAPGYHPREADLYFEIIDPSTGKVLPEGEFGEVVFTTLTRTGMPLIRYRTGDRSRFLPGPCPCGSQLKRLDKVGRRGEING